MSLLFILQSGGSSQIFSFPIMLLMMFTIMYFFFMRPQQKKQKEQVKFQTDLAKGTEIVTTSGIIGKVNKVEADYVQLQLDQKTFINVLHSAISKEMTESYAKGKAE